VTKPNDVKKEKFNPEKSCTGVIRSPMAEMAGRKARETDGTKERLILGRWWHHWN
jgi:hypothetical protein